MIPYWFGLKLPASRHGIENAVRLALWANGFGDSYITCIDPEPPVKCEGLWRSTEPFSIEWVPMDYFLLKLKEPNREVLQAFERALQHRALAAYRDPSGTVVVEWRAREPEARWQELEQSKPQDLEKLS